MGARVNAPITCQCTNPTPAKFVFAGDEDGRRGQAIDSIICDGCILSGGTVRNSVLSPGVRVHGFAEITDSVIFPDVIVNREAKLKNCIIEKGVVIPEGVEIGFNPEQDAKRYHITDEGLVVVPKDVKFY